LFYRKKYLLLNLMSLNNWLDIFGQIFKKAGLTQTFLRKKVTNTTTSKHSPKSYEGMEAVSQHCHHLTTGK